MGLPNKNSISGQRCERANMAANCEMFMNWNENFIGIWQKHILLLNKEFFSDPRCEKGNMAYKCKIFEGCQLNTSWALYTCLYIVHSYWHK